MAAAGESTQEEEEDIAFPAISPAPVLIALLNLIQALVIWVVAVTVHLPRYLLFSKQRRITIDVKEPTGETRRWCRENPGLRGFVLELQTPTNTFKAYKCNATEPVSVLQIHGTEDDLVPYEGYAFQPGALETAQLWAVNNGCSGQGTPQENLDLEDTIEGAETEVRSWPVCKKNSAVELWTVVDGAHVPAFGEGFTPKVLEFLFSKVK